MSESLESPPAAPYKVFIVDDHPMIREHLAQLLEKQPDLHICGEAIDLSQALEGIAASNPDIAIIDISLRSSSGLDLIKEIKARGWPLPILILSMHDESLYAERALRAGALGYINKQESSRNILAAIRKVIARQIHVSPEISERFVRLAIAGNTMTASSPVTRLGDRELEVFQLIGRSVGTRQIAETLGLSVKTVETYRARIKEKLSLENGVQLMRRAVEWVEKYNSKGPT